MKEKVHIIKELKVGKSVPDVAQQFGIGTTQLYKIYKAKDELLKSIESVPQDSKICKTKEKHPAIVAAVFDWFYSLRTLRGARKPLPVSRSLIQARALYEAKQRGITEFKASDGWFGRWRWRYNVGKSVHLHGEAADVNIEEAEREIQVLRQAIAAGGYKQDNIFNMDETALFYRAIRNRTYCLKEGDSRQAGRGSKAMKAKDRLTAIICTNATGTCKISPALVGSSKKPRCFRRNPVCVPYFSQPNAWSDSEIYSKWWNDIFLKEIRTWTTEPIALLIDGFSGHDNNCTDPLGQVTIFKFPPNVTSVFQPLDQGIIAAFKAHYKCMLLEKLVSNAPSFDNLQVMAKQLPAGCAGLEYGNPPHVSDAAQLMKDSWGKITSETIAACWKRAKCLGGNESTCSNTADYVEQIDQESVVQMNTTLSSLPLSDACVTQMLSSNGLDVLTNEVQGTASNMLLEWLHLEDTAEIEQNGDAQDDATEDQLDPSEKVSMLHKMLPMLHNLHAIGVKICDPYITNAARQMCQHVQSSCLERPKS